MTPTLFILLLGLLACQAGKLGQREFVQLPAADIASLVANPDPTKNLDHTDPHSHLSKILIPRAPETQNNTLVRNYIVTTMRALKWHVEEDEFHENTPYGRKRFTNIIATKDPKASRRVLVSAHFDSKFFPTAPENQFLGATDSAVPCAIMLDLAETLNPLLDARMHRFDSGHEADEDVADTTLQLVFFDGEEAFQIWTDTDSIYGARHLAEKWETSYVVPHTKRRLLGPVTTELELIEHFILLDLLGAPDPMIKSYFRETAWLFDAIATVENRLGEADHFVYGNEKGMAKGKWKSYFRTRSGPPTTLAYMGDDHVPFLKRGVNVLHLISEPFPRVWHTLKDDASALDMPTMRRWNIIMRVFIAEYLNLRPTAKRDLPRSGSDPDSDLDLDNPDVWQSLVL